MSRLGDSIRNVLSSDGIGDITEAANRSADKNGVGDKSPMKVEPKKAAETSEEDLGPALVKIDQKDAGSFKADDKIKKDKVKRRADKNVKGEQKSTAKLKDVGMKEDGDVSDEDTITEKEIDDLVDAEDLSEMPDEDDDKKENPFAKKKDDKKENPFAKKKDKKKDDDEDDEDDKDMDDDKKESTMTKAEMIEELSAKMEGLKKGNVRKAYEALMSALDTEEDVEEVIESRFNRDELVIDVTQDVAALLSGEDLSEDFERKAATIFQAAVTDKVEKEINKLDAKFDKMVTEEVSKIHTSLSTQVDEYMTYVSEEWMKENELAIETGIRTELTEDFISGLKSLFEKNYIDIPEDKVDVVEELTNKVEELEATLNEQMEKNIELSKDNDTKDRVTIVSEVCDGLADTEAEKIAGLSENVSYTDAESFKDSISTLRESYFPKSTVQEEVEPEVLSESADSENTVISDEAVSAAVTALNRTVR